MRRYFPSGPDRGEDRPSCGWLAVITCAGAGRPVARAPIEDLHTFDQQFYLGIAYDLRHSGRFTDGFVFAAPVRMACDLPHALRPAVPAVLSLRPTSTHRSISGGLRRGASLTYACPRDARCALLGSSCCAALPAAVADRASGVRLATRRLACPDPRPIHRPALVGGVNYLMTEDLTLFLTTAAIAAPCRPPSARGRPVAGSRSPVPPWIGRVTRPRSNTCSW